MTISAVVPDIAFAGSSGSGTLGPFSLLKSGTPLVFFSNSEVVVLRYDSVTDTTPTLLVEGTDYTLTGGPTAGSLTLIAPQTGLLTAERLYVTTVAALAQSLDLVNGGNFSSSNLERRLDVIFQILQQHAREIKSTIRFAMFDTDEIPKTTPLGAVIDKVPYVTGTAANPTIGYFDADVLDDLSEFTEEALADIAVVAADLSGADTIGIVAASIDDVEDVAANIGDVIIVANAVGDGTITLVKDTYAALTAIPAVERSNGQKVYVSARAAAGDGGEGYWRFDSASSATANGGTILAPDAGTGRWIRIGYTKITPEFFGAVASASQGTAAANTAAIQAAFEAGVALGVAVEIPKRANPFLVNDNFVIDSDMNGLTICGHGEIKFANALVTDNTEAAWMIYFYDRVTAIEDVTIQDIILNGNRASVTISGVAPSTSFGIVVDQKTLLGDRVEINNVTAKDFVTNGYQISQGPIVIRHPVSYGHGFHGIAIQNDPLGDLFNGWAHIVSPRTKDCEGYGIDFSGGKVLCVDHVDDGSWYGNAKAAEGLEHLILRGALWTNSPGNPADATSGRGFLTTGTAANFADTILDMDGIVIEDADTGGFQIGAFDGQVILGSVIVRRGNAASINAEQGNIQIAAASFTAKHLESEDSTGNGIVITAGCEEYTVDFAKSKRAERAGFTVRATTGACSGALKSSQMVENNQAGLSGASGAAIQQIVSGNIKVSAAEIFDDQGSPTQVSGMYFAGAVKAEVNQCNFGAGITDGQQVYSATSGTRVRFGRNNTGIVTSARGTRTANGGGTNLGFSFPTAMTGLGGAVFFGQMTPASADASGAHYITAPTASSFTLIYTSATPGGTDNVSFRYEAEFEIQR